MTRTAAKYFLIKNGSLVLSDAKLEETLSLIATSAVPAAEGEAPPSFVCIAGHEVPLQIELGPHVRLAPRTKKKAEGNGKKKERKSKKAVVVTAPTPPASTPETPPASA